MHCLKHIFFVLSILTLVRGQKDDSYSCSSNVVVLTKEDLAQEIQNQMVTKPPSSALASESGCVINATKITDEVYNRIVKLDKEKLTDLQEALNCHTDMYASCQEILQQNNNSPSGYYWLRKSDVSAEKVYCDMDKICGNKRGWMRVAQFDTKDSDSDCPDGFYRAEHNNKSLCAPSVGYSGCVASVIHSTRGVRYNEICGRVIAYQKGHLHGWHSYTTINGAYLSGASLTHNNPINGRYHVWSFISTQDENRGCPCINNRLRKYSLPHFIGLNYFCDTGTRQYQHYQDDFRVFTENPLWDGAGCGPNNDCCAFNSPPWFYRHLHYNTTDDMEMRVCRRDFSQEEDLLIEKFDLFIR